MRFYAGIGARATPRVFRDRMTQTALDLREDGWWLRSGGAPGADLAFELGAWGHKEIFRARDATLEALELTARFHPNWEACSGDTQLKHARNAMVVLGRDLVTPVEKVICWTPGGLVTGGTGQALRIAEAYGIPIENWGRPPELQTTMDFGG